MTVHLGDLLVASDADKGKAAPFALFLVLAIGVGIFFLGRSMLKHLRRVPDSFERPDPARPHTSGADGPPSGSTRAEDEPVTPPAP